ncbi:MAG: cupin [Alphaproteobacteria bacterium]|nr:cupin [Alphaproteobacteria bacterium]
MLEFDHIIAPLTRDQFFADYWNKSFIAAKGKAGRFANLLGWEELNAILEQHRLSPPRFRLTQEGRTIEPFRYMSPGAGGISQLNSGKLAACLSGGATLVLDCVEELAPRVRQLAASFRDALRAGNYVNLYAGWHSQNGLDLHWDSQEIMVLQVAGRKRWQIYQPTRRNPLPDDIEAPPKPTGLPVWDGVLEDGDMLYIPRGWWHVAFPLGEPSLHLTVATVPPHGMDLLQWLLGRLRRQEAVRGDLPQLGDAKGQAAYLQALRLLLAEALADDVIAEFRHEWEGDLRPFPHIRLPDMPYVQIETPDDTHRIRLAAAHHLHFVHNGGSMEFKAHDVLWSGLPPDLAATLEMLSDTHAVTFGELCSRLNGDAAIAHLRQTLAALARAGVVLIEKP